MGRAAIRAVASHPGLRLTALLSSSRAGEDAGVVAGLPPLGLLASSDVDAVLATGVDAVVYTASGDLRPDEAAADVARCLRVGAVVVTPSLYALHDVRSAPASLASPLSEAALEGRSALFVSGIDPGWGNDVLPLLAAPGVPSMIWGGQLRLMSVEPGLYDALDVPLSPAVGRLGR